VSRAPLAKLRAYKQRMGWTFPWASAGGSDFNYDFHVSLSEEQQGAKGYEYNFQRQPPRPEIATRMTDVPNSHAAMCGVDTATYLRDLPGMSSFVLEDGEAYHAYSTYARGLDGLWGMYQWLDRAPLGRNEQGAWWRRHNEYDPPVNR
jgi:predicted dithiol-disulfide oxidoreductase (DUF899 family)